MSEPNYGIGYDIPGDAAPHDLYEAEQIAALHGWKSFDEYKALAGVLIHPEFFHPEATAVRTYVAWIGEYVKFKKQRENFDRIVRRMAAGRARYRRRIKR